MKKSNVFIFVLATLLISACSPRVEDIFEESSALRLEHSRDSLRKQLIANQVGWVMEYFPQSNETQTDTAAHKGYTFLMEFRDDETVTIGAMVDGEYKTETSLWDVINDNSTVLTFNSYNSIFHLYSNPDPEGHLFNVDGIGHGGDYEFMVLAYNKEENYLPLLGKKRYTNETLTPLAQGTDWEAYLATIESMNQRLFSEDVPYSMVVKDKRFTLYNAYTHEFRAFAFGADTLGGGNYYGFIVNPQGIRLNNDSLVGLEVRIGKEPFILNANGDKLISKGNDQIYITLDGGEVMLSQLMNDNNEILPATDALPASMKAAIDKINQSLSQIVKNSFVSQLEWTKVDTAQIGLMITYKYKVGTVSKTSQATYYYDITEGLGTLTLKANGKYTEGSILHEYGAQELIDLLNGTYTMSLVQGFAPSKGIRMAQKENQEIDLVVRP